MGRCTQIQPFQISPTHLHRGRRGDVATCLAHHYWFAEGLGLTAGRRGRALRVSRGGPCSTVWRTANQSSDPQASGPEDSLLPAPPPSAPAFTFSDVKPALGLLVVEPLVKTSVALKIVRPDTSESGEAPTIATGGSWRRGLRCEAVQQHCALLDHWRLHSNRNLGILPCHQPNSSNLSVRGQICTTLLTTSSAVCWRHHAIRRPRLPKCQLYACLANTYFRYGYFPLPQWPSVRIRECRA